MTLWSGLWVPKNTPKGVVAKPNAAAVDALNDPAVRKQLENLGLQMPPKDKLAHGGDQSWLNFTGRRPPRRPAWAPHSSPA
jgi:hypothetical protein